MNEENKTIPMWKLKLQIKAKQVTDFAIGVTKDTAKWVMENPQSAALLVTTGLAVANKATKIKNDKAETAKQMRSFYDPRRGKRSYAKRNLRKSELRTIERLYEEGHSYQSILDDMGLLK